MLHVLLLLTLMELALRHGASRVGLPCSVAIRVVAELPACFPFFSLCVDHLLIGHVVRLIRDDIRLPSVARIIA